MIARVTDRFDLKPKRLAGDSAYGAAPMLAWLVKDKADRPAYTGVRQVPAGRWHSLTGRLYLRC